MSTEHVKDVYTIIKNGEKAFWQKIGRAHVNKMGAGMFISTPCRLTAS